MTFTKLLGLAAAAAISVFAATTAVADSHSLGEKSGTVEVRKFRIGFIIGYTGGDGTLKFKGGTHPFSIKGLRLGATGGIAESDLSGNVYNLKSVDDFAGTYEADAAGIALIKGIKHYTLVNRRTGVKMQIAGQSTGVEVALDVGGMKIEMK